MTRPGAYGFTQVLVISYPERRPRGEAPLSRIAANSRWLRIMSRGVCRVSHRAGGSWNRGRDLSLQNDPQRAASILRLPNLCRKSSISERWPSG